MATYFGSILCKIFALCFALRFVSSCREVFLTVPLVDVRDCLSNCERDSRCSTYYFKGSASGRSTCVLSEFGLQTKHGGYQGLARVLTRLRDDGPWDEQIAQQIRPALKVDEEYRGSDGNDDDLFLSFCVS
ncbi:uncharacterized protein LOC116301851 [Actinia tenebrosa]|uniref:Uncharacterized protein LOC116301851 n=1 Tax=Actinia tenebrosa TaxID=6105 RepID=A0A6P8IJ36_ACTTE|nr:uncharacterized protein LOC116301851 [Actinia tenebrosa]